MFATETKTVRVETSTAIPSVNKEYVLDSDKLKQLKKQKVLMTNQYIYFALYLSYDESEFVNIDIAQFCERWDVAETDFLSVIAALEKKSVLSTNATQLELKLF